MSWEIDVFGRVRRSIESADASLDASVESYRDVLVTLLAEVALTYIDVRALQARIRYRGLQRRDPERHVEAHQRSSGRLNSSPSSTFARRS